MKDDDQLLVDMNSLVVVVTLGEVDVVVIIIELVVD